MIGPVMQVVAKVTPHVVKAAPALKAGAVYAGQSAAVLGAFGIVKGAAAGRIHGRKTDPAPKAPKHSTPTSAQEEQEQIDDLSEQIVEQIVTDIKRVAKKVSERVRGVARKVGSAVMYAVRFTRRVLAAAWRNVWHYRWWILIGATLTGLAVAFPTLAWLWATMFWLLFVINLVVLIVAAVYATRVVNEQQSPVVDPEVAKHDGPEPVDPDRTFGIPDDPSVLDQVPDFEIYVDLDRDEVHRTPFKVGEKVAREYGVDDVTKLNAVQLRLREAMDREDIHGGDHIKVLEGFKREARRLIDAR